MKEAVGIAEGDRKEEEGPGGALSNKLCDQVQAALNNGI